MSRKLSFTQADIRRFYKGAAEAGVTIMVEIGADGAIRGIPCELRSPAANDGPIDVMQRISEMKI